MSGFAHVLDVGTVGDWQIFAICTVFTFIVVTAIWVMGVFQGNHSMMDGYYGFGYAIPVWMAFWLSDAKSQTAVVLLVLVSFHGCRLGYYLAARWRRLRRTHGGDARYIQFSKKFSPGYWWKSFFRVMEPQAVLIVVVGSPAVLGIAATREPDGQLGWLAVVGIAVFAVGLYFETLADGQLQAFLADPHNKGRYLRTGVWTHSRHPNYFGTTTVWWGVWLVAVSGAPQLWWTVVGPLANTVLLTATFGSAFQDKYMGDRPEYRKVMAQTRRFFPLPLSERQKQRAQEMYLPEERNAKV